MFSDHSCTRIIFEIDNKPYIPLPPMGSTCNPNAEPGQLVYGDDLGDNILNYLGDNENGVKVGDETSEDKESVGDEVERNDDKFIIGDGVERNEEGEDNEIVGDINEPPPLKQALAFAVAADEEKEGRASQQMAERAPRISLWGSRFENNRT
ncbi:hypothetical protein ACOSP7_009485 [Xanthoceras sorbifolium]